jgi:hypothetical protein
MKSRVKDPRSEDSRIVVIVCTRKADKFVRTRLTVSTTANFELRTRWIKFGSTQTIAEVKSDDFVANEIVAWCNVVWKRYLGGLTIFLNMLVRIAIELI